MARILLVEDDLNVRPLMEHIMVEQGYEVIAAESVASAVTLLGAQPFDLVVCDVKLPDGNGLIVADKAIAAGVGALVITGYGLSIQPGSLAPYDYLPKPVRGDELLAGIRRCLAGRSGGAGVVQLRKPPAS
jgi:DNA-binding NtrC family response regulator